MEEISSPCIGVCTTDFNDVCMGCFRTTQEIAAWASYSEAQRLRIMNTLEQRRDAYYS